MALSDILSTLAAIEDFDTTEIQTAIETEFNTASDAANARVEELIAENAALKAELGEVKARNYDLMVAATSEVEPEPEQVEDDISLDDLFKEV